MMDINTYKFYIGKKVYINLNSNIFYNGVVIDITPEGLLILDDRKVGRTTISIQSISTIEPRELSK